MALMETALVYAARPRVVGKYLGRLFLVLAVLSLAPLVASVVFAEYAYTARFAVVVLGYAAVGALLERLPSPARVQPNEAALVVALAFLIAPVVMAYPLSISGAPFIDVLFEAVSGVTTSGLSTFATVEGQPRTFLFGRAFMQWYGGLGIAVFAVALISAHHMASRRLIESVGEEALATTTGTHARRVLLVYCALTVIGFAVLWTLSGDGFAALTHVMSAVSTGGFSSFDDGLAGFGGLGPVLWTSFLSLCGAVALPLYFFATQRGIGVVSRDEELRALVIFVLVFTVALMWGNSAANTNLDHIVAGLVTVISAQTTTGFSYADTQSLTAVQMGALMIAMLIGGSVGSTAGGIKIYRTLIAAKMVAFLLRRGSIAAHAVSAPMLGGRQLENDEIQRALVVVVLFVATIALSWLPFLAYGYDPLRSLFEVVSATCTVGLSAGITADTLPTPLKLVLCLDMWLGRLEIIGMLVVVYHRVWWGRRVESL